MATRSIRAVASLVSNRRFHSRYLDTVEESVNGAIIVVPTTYHINPNFAIGALGGH